MNFHSLAVQLLRRRAAEVRIVRDKRDIRLSAEQERGRKKTRLGATPEGTLSPRRSPRTAAVLEVVAITDSVRRCDSCSSHRNATQGLIEAVSAAPSRDCALPSSVRCSLRDDGDGNRCTSHPQQKPQLRHTSDSNGANVPFRVCSPASARRRHSLLRQQAPRLKDKHGDFAASFGASVDGVTKALARDCSSQQARTPQQPLGSIVERQALDPDDHSTCQPAVRRGAAVRENVPRTDLSGEVNIGELYAPCAWPVMRVSMSVCEEAEPDPSSGPQEMGVICPPRLAEGGTRVMVSSRMPTSVLESIASGAWEGSWRNVDGQQPCPVNRKASATGDAPVRGRTMSDEERLRASATTAELLEAYQHFRRHCSDYKQYHELQVRKRST